MVLDLFFHLLKVVIYMLCKTTSSIIIEITFLNFVYVGTDQDVDISQSFISLNVTRCRIDGYSSDTNTKVYGDMFLPFLKFIF